MKQWWYVFFWTKSYYMTVHGSQLIFLVNFDLSTSRKWIFVSWLAKYRRKGIDGLKITEYMYKLFYFNLQLTRIFMVDLIFPDNSICDYRKALNFQWFSFQIPKFIKSMSNFLFTKEGIALYLLGWKIG